MANQTVTTDLNMTTVISNGLANGENITINSNATVTVDQSPSVLVGQISINEGEFLLDGANAINPIVFVGERAEEINVNGAGTFRATLGWWEFPSTGNGTASQTFDCSTYFSSSGSGITSDVFAGVWVETGRRINYDGGSGVAPVVGDWVFKVSDTDVHGRIEEVNGTATSGYIVVTFLTGSLADNDAIELHTIQDNAGPDYQISWTANAVGADVLESGVFQEFGNCYQNSVDYLTSMGSGISGFAYSQPYQNNTLTFGDGVNGFIVPAGARVRVPMVHICTSSTTEYPLGSTVWEASAANMYELETVNGGDCFLAGVSVGSAQLEDNLGNEFQASYCATSINMGVYGALSRPTYDHCIFVSDIVGDQRSQGRSVPPIVDLVSGADIRDCIGVFMNDAAETTQFGGQTSLGVNIERVIQLGNGAANEFEALRLDGVTINDLVVVGTQVVFTTMFNGDVRLLKTQRNFDGTVAGSDQVVFNASSNSVKVTGWEILQNSCPDDSKMIITDCSNIGVRGFHFIDRKFDNEALGVLQGEEFCSIGGLCADITLARCWQDNGNPNEFVFVASGTSKNVKVLNCSAQYNGEVEPDGINTMFRGLHSGSGNLGSGSGLETDYPGTAGAHCGDVFESGTKGYIYYRNVPGTDDFPITVTAGSPIFTKDGDVDVTSGDQWEVDMGYFALGHTGFSGVLTTTRNGGQNGEGVDTWTGVDIDFQYDTGSGYNGTWLDLRTPVNLTAITDTTDGVRLKLRFTGNATQTNGQAITIHTSTTLADQIANYHPLDQQEVSLSVTARAADTSAVIEGARVYLLAGSGGPLVEGTVIMDSLTNASGQVTVPTFVYSADQPVVGRVRKGSESPFYKTSPLSGTITTAGFDTTAFMVGDG